MCHGDIRSDILIKADGKDAFCFLSLPPPPFFFLLCFPSLQRKIEQRDVLRVNAVDRS